MKQVNATYPWLLVIGVLTLGAAGCVAHSDADPEEALLDEPHEQAASPAAEPSALSAPANDPSEGARADEASAAPVQCNCSNGWNCKGVPITTTKCGLTVCGMDLRSYTCTSTGWQAGSACTCN